MDDFTDKKYISCYLCAQNAVLTTSLCAGSSRGEGSNRRRCTRARNVLSSLSCAQNNSSGPEAFQKSPVRQPPLLILFEIGAALRWIPAHANWYCRELDG